MDRSESLPYGARLEADGTYTVDIVWCSPIAGIPTKELAMRVESALQEAMSNYAEIATYED